MKRQTAVQWYADKQESLQGIFSLGGITATEYYEKMTELVKKSMELEEQQIEAAFMAGGRSAFNMAKGRDFQTLENYYNEFWYIH